MINVRKLLVLGLTKLGYEVFEADMGLSAFRQARATPPDLIPMDLGLPLVGGDEVIAWLKTDLVTRHIPIIVTTALLSGPAIGRAIAAGAAEILYEPFTIDALNTTRSGICQRHPSFDFGSCLLFGPIGGQINQANGHSSRARRPSGC